ncbi:MAG TPA: hypothetical protein VHM24_01810 [Gemmatimonadaceae bacterium]|nr:hypothetical protein [Gemmatimonadaceae bacterium]
MSRPNHVSRAMLAALSAAALLYGCASSATNEKENALPSASPLAGMAGRHMVVFPAQYLSTPGSAGSWEVSQAGPSLLPILDEEIADQLRKRGVNNNWTFAREIIQSAERNAGLAGDPRQLAAQGIRRSPAGDTPLPEPLASQIRTLVSLTSARFALLPIETRLDSRSAERKAIVRVLLIDSRTARILWAGDIEASAPPAASAEALSPYAFRILVRDVATRFADMVVAQ